MKTSNCPTCGAQVQFRSAGSALAVCSYCRSTVLRDGTRVADLGKLSEILDDFSPVQVGTGGTWKAKPVTVIGRLRLKYEDGKTEEIPLKNGEQFADYIRRVDVPGSKFAYQLRGQQIRYFAVQPQRKETIKEIELVKGPDATAPVIIAVTVEGP